MRLSIISSLFLAAVSGVFADEGDSSDVLNLTAANFDEVVKPASLILVEFFAPWCGHCKALAPHYEEAATALKVKNIPIAKVDCVEQSELCQTHGVGGYPTLKVFKSGTPSEYNGPRKADGIISYMVKQSLPAVSPVTAESHDEFKASDKVVVVLYATETSEAPVPVFSSVAEQHRDDYLFGIVTDPAVIQAADIVAPALVVYKKFDDGRSDYPSAKLVAVTKEELSAWLKESATPLFDEVSGDNYSFYAESGLPLAYLFLDTEDSTYQDKIKDYQPLAKTFKGKVNFVWINANKFAEHGKAMNLPEAKWPAFVVHDMAKGLKFPYDQKKELKLAAVEQLVADFLDDKLEPQLKSEPIPESQDESVFVLVTKQFDEVVFDDSKDVLIEFYAPWCGHCKRLKPTWDSLGDKFAAIKDRVIIAKMDATENDIPPSAPFRVSGFPTIKFKKAGSREFIDYEGDRSLESLIEFLETNAKNSLVIPEIQSSSVSPSVEEPTAASTPVATETHQAHVEL